MLAVAILFSSLILLLGIYTMGLHVDVKSYRRRLAHADDSLRIECEYNQKLNQTLTQTLEELSRVERDRTLLKGALIARLTPTELEFVSRHVSPDTLKQESDTEKSNTV